MTKEELDAFRDECAQKHQDFVDKVHGTSAMCLEYESYKLGFDKAIDILLPKLEKTIEALKKIEGGPGVDGSLEAFCVLKELGEL